ncbi:hypothetical protein CSOJ01_08561 [Colletotrichum sojae]|uniref:Uncharacterized protein n=1 Tax=Colletotrichum sojae TaxID=2175907 RepID=A0A8H6J646_9PEZI|nr:hypothetical protein CSOJ01_08561 [Colletotrichum sojae]
MDIFNARSARMRAARLLAGHPHGSSSRWTPFAQTASPRFLLADRRVVSAHAICRIQQAMPVYAPQTHEIGRAGVAASSLTASGLLAGRGAPGPAIHSGLAAPCSGVAPPVLGRTTGWAADLPPIPCGKNAVKTIAKPPGKSSMISLMQRRGALGAPLDVSPPPPPPF